MAFVFLEKMAAENNNNNNNEDKGGPPSSCDLTIESFTPAAMIAASSAATAASSSSSSSAAGAAASSNVAPEPRFNKLSENLRTMTPPEIQCSVFCGGKGCRYENPKAWAKEHQAIDGLYSHWITPNILASSRPSNDQVPLTTIGQMIN